MRFWDICCGIKSVSNIWRGAGHDTLTLDIDPKCSPDICMDIMKWDFTDFSLQPPDFVWCSPPCTEYSIARTRAKTPRDLDGSDAIVQKCLDIIAFWRPRHWMIENPATGLLKTREVVQGLDFIDVDFCMYGAPYRKRTRLWTNIKWISRPLCTHATHPMTAQKGPSKRAGKLIIGDDCSLTTLHSVPQELTREIMMHCTNEQAQEVD